MGQARNIIDDTTLAILRGVQHTQGRYNQLGAERSAALTQRIERQAVENTLRQTLKLAKDKAKLEAELERKNDELLAMGSVLNGWLNNSESYRRALEHLRKNWTPCAGEEGTVVDGSDIVAKKRKEVSADPSWPSERVRLKEYTLGRVVKVMAETKSKSATARVRSKR